MDLINAILGAGGGSDVLQQLARRTGLTPDQTLRAATGMMPALNEGIRKNVRQQGGMEALMGALKSGNHRRYVDSPETLSEEATVSDGNKILGHLLGSKDASRGVAVMVAKDAGLDVGTMKSMLPLVAAMAMGTLSKKAQSSGLMQMFAGGAVDLGEARSSMSLVDGLLGDSGGSSAGDMLSGLARSFLK